MTVSNTYSRNPMKNAMKNIGERDEYRVITEMFQHRQDPVYLCPIFGEEAREGIRVIDPNGKEYQEVAEIPQKAKAEYKGDVTIQFVLSERKIHVSIKSLRGAKPSLVNHTHRAAKVFQEELKDDLVHLDRLAKEYHAIQLVTPKEDIRFGEIPCFAEEPVRQAILKLLVYFVFVGTGAKKAVQACNAILVFHKDRLEYISCGTEEERMAYVSSQIDQCRVSFRDKGMSKTNELKLPWVGIYYSEKKGKPIDYGAIHVRMAKD